MTADEMEKNECRLMWNEDRRESDLEPEEADNDVDMNGSSSSSSLTPCHLSSDDNWSCSLVTDSE